MNSKCKFVQNIYNGNSFFLVEESIEGGYTAKGLGVSIFTQAISIEEFRKMVKYAVECHFDDNFKRIIRLHIG